MRALLKRARFSESWTASAALSRATRWPRRQAAGTDWPVSGHDAGGQRYSPLTQINKSNVASLQSPGPII